MPKMLTLCIVLLMMIINGIVVDVFGQTCVDINSEEYTCSMDPVNTRKTVDKGIYGMSASDLTTGVDQRIDGSDKEKADIKEVLEQMDHYFVHEVLSKPQYASVRTKCKNTNELCAFWSAVGECESNRVFMLSNCAAACQFCLLLHTDLA